MKKPNNPDFPAGTDAQIGRLYDKNTDKKSEKFREISVLRNKMLTYALLVGGILASKAQTNPDFAIGKYNTIEKVVDYNGPASDIEAQFHQNDTTTETAWEQSVETECLNSETTVNGNANVPASVIVAGNLVSTATNYRKWVRNEAPYNNGNGRPDAADDRRGYVYQLQENSDIFATTYGNGTGYSTSVYTLASLDGTYYTDTHEGGHQLGLFHSDATEFVGQADIFDNGNYIYDKDIKTVMAGTDMTGFYSIAQTCSVNNRTDIADNGFVYSTYKNGSGTNVNYRVDPALLATSASGETALGKLGNRLKNGGSIHSRVKEKDVPANQKIENIAFNYSINGNILTVENFAEFDALVNPNNGQPEKCEVFAYRQGDTADGHQVAKLPAPYSNRIGWKWDANGQIDFTDFLATNGGTLSNYEFCIRATKQNKMGQVGMQTTGVAEQNIAGFKMYPNPVKDKLVIKTADDAIEQITIYNELGRQIFLENYDKSADLLYTDFDVQGLKTGLYFAKIQAGGKIVMKRFIKE